jgi:hypothetical protein
MEQPCLTLQESFYVICCSAGPNIMKTAVKLVHRRPRHIIKTLSFYHKHDTIKTLLLLRAIHTYPRKKNLEMSF